MKVTQSCLTLCNPMNYTVHGILQARTLKSVAVPFSRGTFQPRELLHNLECYFLAPTYAFLKLVINKVDHMSAVL